MQDIPPALEREPELNGEAADIMSAFWTLTNSRRVGMGPGGIPIESIEAYCRLHFVIDAMRLIRFLSYLDGEFLSYCANKIKERT